jgi:hypothetical protein
MPQYRHKDSPKTIYYRIFSCGQGPRLMVRADSSIPCAAPVRGSTGKWRAGVWPRVEAFAVTPLREVRVLKLVAPNQSGELDFRSSLGLSEASGIAPSKLILVVVPSASKIAFTGLTSIQGVCSVPTAAKSCYPGYPPPNQITNCRSIGIRHLPPWIPSHPPPRCLDAGALV